MTILLSYYMATLLYCHTRVPDPLQIWIPSNSPYNPLPEAEAAGEYVSNFFGFLWHLARTHCLQSKGLWAPIYIIYIIYTLYIIVF